MARKPRYQKIEQEDLKLLKKKPTVECICGDKIEVGSMKNTFLCPSCGRELNTEDAE